MLWFPLPCTADFNLKKLPEAALGQLLIAPAIRTHANLCILLNFSGAVSGFVFFLARQWHHGSLLLPMELWEATHRARCDITVSYFPLVQESLGASDKTTPTDDINAGQFIQIFHSLGILVPFSPAIKCQAITQIHHTLGTQVPLSPATKCLAITQILHSLGTQMPLSPATKCRTSVSSCSLSLQLLQCPVITPTTVLSLLLWNFSRDANLALVRFSGPFCPCPKLQWLHCQL